MRLSLSILLPRDRSTITVSRHVIGHALRAAGVEDDCVHDIAIAQSEACTNVIDHSGPGDEYEVKVEVNDARCVISVTDTGRGFDYSALGDGSDLCSERGRGIQLMRALVDQVHFRSGPEAGTAVHLEKKLSFREGAAFGQP